MAKNANSGKSGSSKNNSITKDTERSKQNAPKNDVDEIE